MINKSSIDESTSDHVSKVLREDPAPGARAEAKEIVDFYLKNYEIVQVVRCDGCGNDLCIEVLDPDQYMMNKTHYHHEGLRMIELTGGTLLARRKRLDGTMGYECRCGNNTLNSEVELGIIPSIKVKKGSALAPAAIPTIQPHHESMVADQITKSGYEPDIKVDGAFKTIETFTIERLKGPSYA